jgi:flavin-dependent dehydrogenase
MTDVIPFKGDDFAAKLNVAKKVDVVVVGGGPAGFVAALSARRNGASTLLIEREGFLGGMVTGSVGGIAVNGLRTQNDTLLVKGIGKEYLDRLEKRGGGSWDPNARRMALDPALAIHQLDEMMEESCVEVLFNTIAFGAIVENNVVKGIAIANKSGGQVT